MDDATVRLAQAIRALAALKTAIPGIEPELIVAAKLTSAPGAPAATP